MRRWTSAAVVATAFCAAVAAAPAPPPPYKNTDLSKGKNVYAVGYSHLDTQWRWSYLETIGEYIPKTMRDNFAFFEKYPNYVFNFTGANRYRMMKEYYPKDYEKVKEYVRKGRWYPNGSSWEECDVNVPSAESLVRQVLYGNRYFREEFGVTPIDFILPDCFGFPASLPSILAHCGVTGFTTQKLTWGSAVGIPFTVGNWYGPDGRFVVSALDPGSYSASADRNLSNFDWLLNRINTIGEKSGAYVDYRYYGTGDTGGAPTEDSVRWMENAVTQPGPLNFISAPADQMFKDLTPQQVAKLPTYRGELELTNHSAGSLTSQAYVKRWNRKNELLADAAERASVAADWLGALPYPREKLTEAWKLLLGTQFHDILPGTSIPKAYEYSWNDHVVALNHSAAALTGAAGAVARAMDTRAAGVPVVVYNPLSIAREDVVDATVQFPGAAPKHVRVFGPDGKETPSQVVSRSGNTAHVLFLARVPSVGFASYDVRPSAAPCAIATGLKAGRGAIENARYKVTLNAAGDVAQVYDKTAKRNLLSSPIRMAFSFDEPEQWPAWNMDWKDNSAAPREYLGGPAKVRVIENGPVRVALEISRSGQGSTFTQVVRLAAAGAGNRVEFADTIGWNTYKRNLKVTFPLAVSNPDATYSLAAGTIKRGNNVPERFEVVAHQWFDLTSPRGDYGVAVLNDSKYGSDKPNDNTLRLTLIRTPGARSYQDQATQDIGRHEVLYGLQGHTGDWRKGKSYWEAARLNQPLAAFQTTAHTGALGRGFSLLRTSTDQVAISAVKLAEDGKDIIVRLQELSGSPVTATVKAAAPVVSAREVDGQERNIGKAAPAAAGLVVKMTPYTTRAFAVRLGRPAVTLTAPVSKPLFLPYNLSASTRDGERDAVGFDGKGHTIAADLLPATIVSEGITFRVIPGRLAERNAVICNGQKIPIPAGRFSTVYILAASKGGDQRGVFQVGGKPVSLTVQDWSGFIGQWDNRIWDASDAKGSPRLEGGIYGLKPAYIKRDTLAWVGRHRHTAKGSNDIYAYSYLFKYALPLTAGAKSITLPRNTNIRVFAITAALDPNAGTKPAQFLYDTFPPQTAAPVFSPAPGSYSNTVSVSARPSLYVTDAVYRYTTDGSAPTPKSPVLKSTLSVSRDTVVKVRPFYANGAAGPVTSARYSVKDTTSPSIKGVVAMPGSNLIRVTFSEPVTAASAGRPSSYSLSDGLEATAAKTGADGRTVDLTVSPAPSAGQTYTLSAPGVKDTSPKGNAVGKAFAFSTVSPALTMRTNANGDALADGDLPQGSVSYTGNPQPASDDRGTSLSFDGSTDGVLISDAPALNPTGAITIAAWFYAEDWNGNRRIAQKGRTDNQYRLLAEEGRLVWDIAGVGELQAPLPAPKAWHCVVATYDGDTMRLYVDGNPVGSLNAGGEIPVTRDPLGIGTKPGRTPAVDHFRGRIREVRLYDVALLPQHVKSLTSD
jgi:alpha-mannosidase